MSPLPSLSSEDAEYTESLWNAYGPGIGIAEALLEAGRVLDYRLERDDNEEDRVDIRTEMERIDRISEALYDDRISEIARALRDAEDHPIAALEQDAQGLSRPFARMKALGETDGEQGWIDSMGSSEVRQECAAAVYALRQQIHLSDPNPGDTFAQSPRGQAARHYWQGASRALTRRALAALEPGRDVKTERRLQHTAATMDDLEFEEHVTELREEAVEATNRWLFGEEDLPEDEVTGILTAIHQYMVANDIAADRSNRAVVDAYAEARAQGSDDREAFESFAEEAAQSTGFGPDEVREIAEGVVPGDARSALSLRRFRSARQMLEERLGRPREGTDQSVTDGQERERSAGRGR